MRETFLYEKLVSTMVKKIESKAYGPGEKLPSIRKLAAESGAGIITVQKAYDILQDRGLISPVDRSGYFVTPQFTLGALPKSPMLLPLPGKEGFVNLAKDILAANRNDKLIPFGAAALSKELLPTEELRTRQARIERAQFSRIMNYEPLGGAFELREAISRRASLWGKDLSPEQILVTNGGTQAIHLALQTVLKPGCRVAVESPCYFGTLWTLEKLGMTMLEIPTSSDEGIQVDLLEKSFKQKLVHAAVLHPNFQNPLGSLMPDSAKQRIAELAAHYKIPVIEADTTADLYLGESRPKPIQAFDQSGWVLSYASFSKLVAPGFRLGYLSPGRYLHSAEENLRAISLATATGPQLSLAKFLRDGGYERHLARLRRHFQTHLPRAISAIREAFPASSRVSAPRGGYLLWIQLPDGTSSYELWSQALKKGISVTPGLLFSTTKKYHSYIRLNLGMAWSGRVEAAIETLGRLL